MKKLNLINVIIMLCILVSCSISNESMKEQTEQLQEVNLNQTEKPPSLIINSGEKVIKTRLGSYSWSYLDSKTGQMVGVEAESIPPTELVTIKDAVNININELTSLSFEKEPIIYEMKIYNNNAMMTGTYNDFQDIKEKGIVEILVTWEEGKASYAVALNIQ